MNKYNNYELISKDIVIKINTMKKYIILFLAIFIATITKGQDWGIANGLNGVNDSRSRKASRDRTMQLIEKMSNDESKKEVSLFNSEGEATAYIDSKDFTIYLWNGKPVVYLLKEGGVFNIYGFNGKHIGWYENGIIRGHKGYVVGYTKGSISNSTKHVPYKPYKKYKPYKSYKEHAPYKPYNKNQFSDEALGSFLIKGKK